MIEVELPDGTIAEFPVGTNPEVIKTALKRYTGQSEPKGSLYAFGSGAVRAIPQGLDLAGAAVAEGADRLMGGEGGYFKGFMQPAQTPLDDLTTAVIGPEYDAQGFGENAAKFAGGVVGPVGAVKGAKNFIGFLQGLGGSMDNYIRDPEKLKEVYRLWKDGLESVPVSSKELQRELVNPTLEKVGTDAKYATREGKDKLEELYQLGQEDTSLGEVYSLRKSLGNVKDNAVTEPIRQQTKTFMADRVGDEGLDAYRRAMISEELSHALRNMGNEGIKATRTRISNLDETGMSAAEIAAKQEAVRGGMGEGLLRGGQAALGAIPSAIVGGPAAPALYGLGRSLGVGADSLAKGRINALQEVLLNKRAAPNIGERAGDALKRVLEKTLLKDQEGALRIGNAADDLPMDTASRMQRAREMGFDVDNPVYHGTVADIAQFNPSTGGKMGAGVYMSDNPVYASAYGQGAGGNVIKSVVRGKIAGGQEASVASEKARAMLQNDPSTKDLPNRQFNSLWKETRNKILQSEGFDGLKLSDETVVFDPKNIRSVNAKFDPAKKDSANLLAGAAASAVGVGGLMGGQANAQGLQEQKARATLSRVLQGK